MQSLVNFEILYSIYDYFIVDLWGTVHDGKRLLPGVKERLQALKQLKKTIVFLSNAPRPSDPIHQFLASMGLTSQDYDLLVTSGDMFLDATRRRPELQRPFYFMGEPFHTSLLEQLHAPTENLADAAYILCSAANPNYETLLQEARQQDKLLVCINPDLAVMVDGQVLLCAGSVARDYERQGGIVQYYGKPYVDIYDHTFQLLGNPPKEKVLMVGDGLYTDILGANRYGIDSLLVNTGVHQVTDPTNPHLVLEKLNGDLGIKPTYFLETLGKK